MSKFKLNPGWTKEKMLDILLTKNNNTQSYGTYACKYFMDDGNRCAIGCFIPEERKDEVNDLGGADDLFRSYPNLLDEMPLNHDGMLSLQMEHDSLNRNAPTHEAFKRFVEERVE